jgi:hypothetical protein
MSIRGWYLLTTFTVVLLLWTATGYGVYFMAPR